MEEKAEGTIRRFEDLGVWQESMRLSVDVYRSLGSSRDFGLKDQMQRSAVSIPSTIAEGYDPQANKDFIRFLYPYSGIKIRRTGNPARQIWG